MNITLAPANSRIRPCWCSSFSNCARKEPRNVVTRGRYEGNRVALEVAVKDRERPDGSKTPWAYYDFTGKPGPSGRGVRRIRQGQARRILLRLPQETRRCG